MKKAFVVLALTVLLQLNAFADPVYHGTTIKQRNAVASVDNWFTTGQNAPRSGSADLKGYNSVRIDVDESVNGATIIGNLATSNDSIWVSGDALTFTKDSYQSVLLKGGSAYYFNIDSISSGTVTVYLTPFNQ